MPWTNCCTPNPQKAFVQPKRETKPQCNRISRIFLALFGLAFVSSAGYLLAKGIPTKKTLFISTGACTLAAGLLCGGLFIYIYLKRNQIREENESKKIIEENGERETPSSATDQKEPPSPLEPEEPSVSPCSSPPPSNREGEVPSTPSVIINESAHQYVDGNVEQKMNALDELKKHTNNDTEGIITLANGLALLSKFRMLQETNQEITLESFVNGLTEEQQNEFLQVWLIEEMEANQRRNSY